MTQQQWEPLEVDLNGNLPNRVQGQILANMQGQLNATYVGRKPAAYDVFAGKPDAVLTSSTRLNSGQSYSVYQNASGVGYQTVGGVLTHSVGSSTSPAAAYAGLDIGERVGRIWAEFTLPTGTAWETLVLIVSASSFTNPAFANSASHFVIGSASYSYEILTASPFATTAIKTGTFDTPMVAGVKYQVSIDFDGDKATITLPAPVNGYKTAVAQDSRIDTYRGQFATIENYSFTGNSNTPININRWGADGVTSVDLSASQASRADVKKAIDAIPASGVLPNAPSATSYAASPSVGYSLGTTAAVFDAANIKAAVVFPPSGKVRWDAQVYCWMNSGAAAGASGWLSIFNGATVVQSIKTIFTGSTEGIYRVGGIITDTPGTTRTFTLGGYASANTMINVASDGANGLETQMTLTPLTA